MCGLSASASTDFFIAFQKMDKSGFEFVLGVLVFGAVAAGVGLGAAGATAIRWFFRK